MKSKLGRHAFVVHAVVPRATLLVVCLATPAFWVNEASLLFVLFVLSA